MEIFNKGDRTGYEEIVSYGPSWWPEYLEMKAVYMYEGWLLDLKFRLLERLVLNQFPSQADEDALAIFERLLKIEYDSALSLEERRRIVQMYYSGTGHLSKSVIETLILTYTGHEGTVYFDEDGTLIIEFNNDDSLDVSLAALQKAIERRLPAHLTYQARCMCSLILGITPKLKYWKKYYTMAGTVPNTNTGLGIAESPGLIAVETVSYSKVYRMCGEDITMLA